MPITVVLELPASVVYRWTQIPNVRSVLVRKIQETSTNFTLTVTLEPAKLILVKLLTANHTQLMELHAVPARVVQLQ